MPKLSGKLARCIWPFFFLWLYLFPDGRAVPRRLRWAIGPLLAVFILLFVGAVFPGSRSQAFHVSADLEPAQFGSVLIALLFFLILGAQVYRYLRVSGPIERDQTKWFIFGLVVAMAFPGMVPYSVIPARDICGFGKPTAVKKSVAPKSSRLIWARCMALVPR